jgi:hypothetical protein
MAENALPLLAVLPVGFAAVFWFGLHRLNRGRGWFRIGELMFWDAIILIIIYLIWLRWF